VYGYPARAFLMGFRPHHKFSGFNIMESLTAKLCAFARAWHSSQSNHAVFNDFLALDFMGQEEYENVSNFILKQFPEESENSVELFNRKYFLPIVLSRSRFAEDRVKLLAQSGKIQYVICGAGVDTFSFRNRDPNVEIFELDLLQTQNYKKKRISKLQWNVSKNVHFVAVDFNKDHIVDKLVENGFNRNKPTIVSILGVSYYLPLRIFAETIRQFSKIATTGISIVFDYLQKDLLSDSVQKLRKIVADCGETMADSYRDQEVFEVLDRHGFKVDEFLGQNALQQRYFQKGKLKAFDSVRLIAAIK
jgi:methyltransferase (TIGR00027 family)